MHLLYLLEPKLVPAGSRRQQVIGASATDKICQVDLGPVDRRVSVGRNLQSTMVIDDETGLEGNDVMALRR